MKEIIQAKNKNEEILKYMNVNKEHSNILRIRRYKNIIPHNFTIFLFTSCYCIS